MPPDLLFARLPVCPALRPGAPVVRRDAQHLQVGVDPPQCVALPDEPDVRAVLGALRVGTRPRLGSPLARRTLAALLDADLIVDSTLLRTPVGAVAAAAHGASAAERLALRADAVVEVRGEDAARARLAEHLGALGCAPPVEDGAPPDIVIVVAPGPLAREDLDDLVRDEVPHLVVSALTGTVTLGPFAVAGLTACVRCVDAHLAEVDPRRSVVWEQTARAPRGDYLPDPALWAMALAWAARDVVALVDGDEPVTWSATTRLAPGLAPVVTRWLRHPHCGCSWAEGVATG